MSFYKHFKDLFLKALILRDLIRQISNTRLRMKRLKQTLDMIISECMPEEKNIQTDKANNHPRTDAKRFIYVEMVVKFLWKQSDTLDYLQRLRILISISSLVKGYMKKDCPKYAAWRVNKCKEANLTFVPIETWWVDSYATININVSMQGCLYSHPRTDAKRFIYVEIVVKLLLKQLDTLDYLQRLVNTTI
ncbi:hypothetical protein V2J09_004230 [Rumex salicifolius]